MVRERLKRRIVPRLIVALSTVDIHRRSAAALRRALGGRGLVTLYVAFDDPSSAVALLGLSERLARRRVRLRVVPVVARGIADDPAAVAKRRYAVLDARRLALRRGLDLIRREPLAATDAAFLAARAAAIGDDAERLAFCREAMRRIWFDAGDSTPAPENFADIASGDPAGPPPAALPGEREMRRRGLYDTPVAVVHGHWYFAHERLDAIDRRLDRLGWGERDD